MSPILTAERLREVLHYDPETGAWTWLVAPRKGRSYVGQRAGALKDDGYRIIGIDGVRYRSNRLAWLYMTGAWPEADVDHRDRASRGDDRWTNLRAATRSQNQGNAIGKGKRWKKGVSLVGTRFKAQIMKDGINHHIGCFS